MVVAPENACDILVDFLLFLIITNILSIAASITANSVRYDVMYFWCQSTGSLPVITPFEPVLECIVNALPHFPFLIVLLAAAINHFSMFSRVGSFDDLRIFPCSLVYVSSEVVGFKLSFLTERMLPPLDVILAGIQVCMLQEDIFMYPLGPC